MGNGKEAEADEIYKIFDRKDKNSVALNEIRHVFHQFLDHARRPFDDLARRDLVDEGLRETLDRH